MGSKRPSKPKITDQERMAAAVGLAEYRIFKDLYLGDETRKGPLLRMRDQAQSEDFTKLFQSRANADLAQQLQQESGVGKYIAATDITRAAKTGKAIAKGQQKASANALKAKVDQQNAVLSAARKQAAQISRSLAASAKIDTSEALSNYNAEVKRKAQQMALVNRGLAGGISNVMNQQLAMASTGGSLSSKQTQGAFLGGALSAAAGIK